MISFLLLLMSSILHKVASLIVIHVRMACYYPFYRGNSTDQVNISIDPSWEGGLSEFLKEQDSLFYKLIPFQKVYSRKICVNLHLSLFLKI